MSDNNSSRRTRRSILKTAGTAGILAALAGCFGTNSETDNEESNQSEPDVEANLISTFTNISFSDGQMLVDLADEFALDELVLTDPLGQQVGQVSPDSAERTAAFDLYDNSVVSASSPIPGRQSYEFYTSGEYRLLGYVNVSRLTSEDGQDDNSTIDIDPEETIVTNGLALVSFESVNLEPKPVIEQIEPADEPGSITVMFTNEGTGPLPIQYRGGAPDRTPGSWEVTESGVQPGESVSITLSVGQAARVNIDDENERDEVRSTYCNGETFTQFIDIFVSREQISRDVRTLSRQGDVVFEDVSGFTDERVYCTEITEEE
jgi:hypothetical protein